MAGKPQDKPMIREHRQAEANAGDPIHDEEMSVYDNGGTLVVGVTSFARKLHRLTRDDTVTVEVYDGGIWIDTGGEADE
jgi:hypothetical protein